MTIHLLRDYFTQNTTTNNAYIFPYVLSIFMRRVLKYTYVGDTNYNINSIGSLLIATGDSNPTGASSWAAGTKAGINIGSQKEYYVTIPSGVRTVSGADIGRLLVLRSTAYPRYNSGVYLIVGIEASSNSYVIDYRTLGEKPPIEALDSIEWYLYERDTSAPINGAANSKTAAEYRGDADSATPRLILQSPHVLGWQVRICNEVTSDISTSATGAGTCPVTSVAPGFGGTGAGDYPMFGQHFHAPMWYNSSSNIYVGGATGMGTTTGTGIQYRITIAGDDTGQGIIMYCRRQNNATSPNSYILAFGLPENETTPLPVNNQARLFVVGSGFAGPLKGNDGGLQYSLVDGAGPTNAAGYSQGMSATPFGTPCVCSPSMWSFIVGGIPLSPGNPGQGTGPQADPLATDSPFFSATELLPIDLMQGTLSNWSTSSVVPVYPFSPKMIGTIPHIRQGRANFGDFSPTTDPARAYQHLRRGLYIPWNGPNLIP